MKTTIIIRIQLLHESLENLHCIKTLFWLFYLYFFYHNLGGGTFLYSEHLNHLFFIDLKSQLLNLIISENMLHLSPTSQMRISITMLLTFGTKLRIQLPNLFLFQNLINFLLQLFLNFESILSTERSTLFAETLFNTVPIDHWTIQG